MRTLCAVLLALSLVACSKGPTGPMGPQGPAGPGSRQVFEGTITSDAQSPNGQTINIPSLNMDAGPLVAVYVRDQTNDWTPVNLIVYDGSNGTYPLFEAALLRTGSVTLYSTFVGQRYRIVIVT